MKGKKKLLIFLSVFIIIFIIVGINEVVINRINDKELTKLEDELKSNPSLSKYFISINASEDTITEPLKYRGYKVFNFNILGSGNEKFLALSDNEKMEQLEVISKIASKYYGNSSNFIDCGKNKFCDIDEIRIFDDTKSGSDSYSIKFDTYDSPDSMEITYYDENDKRQTRTVSKDKSVTANTTPSKSNTTQTKILTVEEASCTKDGGYMYAKGYVKNNSDQFLSFIEVKADFINSSGSIVDTNYTYAVGSEGLAPNSRKSFDIMTPTNDSVTKCNYKIVDYQ